ncbi:MAG: class I SAM-dependent methyltransferase [Bacteroidota bacterium]|jgi:SAM-dependent methyltransferase
MATKEWFAEWFDTPYYHILYRDRDEAEAKRFILNLLNFLKLPKHSKVLDLGCGKGRHCMTLHEQGYSVTGADLSPKSISRAKKDYPEEIQFIVHDMRKVIPSRSFTAVFNLFTSFGYFDSQEDNLRVLRSIHSMLEVNGFLIIDFMNAKKVIQKLVPSEEKEVEGITFRITRRYDGTHIYKNIVFETDGQHLDFTERVQGLQLEDFKQLLADSDFSILRTFGDFDLNDFDASVSDRLILIAQRT